jgi:hypothetical protein
LKISVICFSVVLCAIFSAFPLGAADFGAVLDQGFSITGYDDEQNAAYTGTLAPWFSALPSPDIDVYVSLGLNAHYEHKEGSFVPELLRTQLTWRVSEGMEINAGRMLYADPLGLVISGLFDGASVSRDIGAALVSAGLWYSGLLYKKTTVITVTPDDEMAHNTQFAWDEFGDTYFASRRLLGAVDFFHPSLADMLRLGLSFSAQIDLNERDLLLHSQYFSAKASVPVKSFLFSLGGSLETLQSRDEFKLGLLGEIGAAWMLPGKINDRLSLNARFSSGVVEDSALTAFAPLTDTLQGNVLQAKLSGISVLQAEYTARLHRRFSLGGELLYFIRGDKGTFQGISAPDGGYMLGAELYGWAIWSPVSDIQVNFGGGAFLPMLGDAAPSDFARWKLEIGVAAALY